MEYYYKKVYRFVQEKYGVKMKNKKYEYLIEHNFLKLNILLIILLLIIFLLSIGNHRDNEIEIYQSPFMDLDIIFWVGLFFTIILLFLNKKNKFGYVYLFMIFIYSTFALEIIQPLPRMHDSPVNIYGAIKYVLTGTNQGYSSNYPNFYLFVGILGTITKLDIYSLSDFFVYMTITIYFFTFIALYRNLFIDPDSGSHILYTYFIAIFGSTFMLRINAAPQTLGFILFLSILIIVSKSSINIYKYLYLLIFSSLVMYHPISPFLTIFSIVPILIHKNMKKYLGQMFVLSLIIYMTWTLYNSYLFSSFEDYFVDITNYDRTIPSISTIPGGAESYVFINRIYIVSILAFLFLLYIRTYKSKAFNMLLAWSIFIGPLYLFMTAYRFMDRILLFSIPFLALIFSEGINSFPRTNKIKFFFIMTIIVLLSIVSVYRSYYLDNFDRITVDEIDLHKFTSSYINSTIYIGGFNLPVEYKGELFGIYRGQTDVFSRFDIETILISPQIKAGAVLNEGGYYNDTSLGKIERIDLAKYSVIYDSAYGKIYRKM